MVPCFRASYTCSILRRIHLAICTGSVVVEERISKTVPVNVQYVGNVAEDFMADKENKVLDFNEVSITGPKSTIDQIASAQIKVDLEGRSESISEQFAYTLCNDKGEPVNERVNFAVQ